MEIRYGLLRLWSRTRKEKSLASEHWGRFDRPRLVLKTWLTVEENCRLLPHRHGFEEEGKRGLLPSECARFAVLLPFG